MLAELTSEQLSEWQVYTSYFDPLPDTPRESAHVVSTLVNLLSTKGKTTLDDFLPIAKPPRPRQSSADHLAIMGAFAKRHNATCR